MRLVAGRPSILVVTSTYPRRPDDVLPRFVHDLCSRLTADFDTHLLAPSTPGAATYERMDGVHVHRFRYWFRQFQTLANVEGLLPAIKAKPWRTLLLPFFFFAEVLSIARLSRRYGISVIHAHWIVPQGFAAWLAVRLWRLHLPVVITCHGADLFALNGALFRAAKRTTLASAAAVTVVSEAGSRKAAALGALPERLFVYPMGVDLRERFTIKANIAREPATLLFVGRLNGKKGADVLVRAVALIRKRLPQIRAEVVGYGPDESSLRTLARELSVADAIHFRGAVPQDALADFYRRATCLIFPSIVAPSGDQEGLGLVPVEALGCGCPVVASRLDAVIDIIEDGRTGWFFEPGNVEELATKVLHVLEHYEEALKIAEAGRAQVVARNDWVRIARLYGQLFKDTLNGPKPAAATSDGAVTKRCR